MPARPLQAGASGDCIGGIRSIIGPQQQLVLQISALCKVRVSSDTVPSSLVPWVCKLEANNWVNEELDKTEKTDQHKTKTSHVKLFKFYSA